MPAVTASLPPERKWILDQALVIRLRPLRLGGVKRAVGAGEECVRRLVRASASRRRRKSSPACPAKTRSSRDRRRSRAAGRACARRSARRIGQHQQEFLAAVAAEPVDAADVGEHGDGEGPQHFVAGRMAIGVVDALEPVEIDQRIEDAYGHPTGDEVLRTFSITMFANIRSVDRSSGGEEFLLVLPDMGTISAGTGARPAASDASRSPMEHGFNWHEGDDLRRRRNAEAERDIRHIPRARRQHT